MSNFAIEIPPIEDREFDGTLGAYHGDEGRKEEILRRAWFFKERDMYRHGLYRPTRWNQRCCLMGMLAADLFHDESVAWIASRVLNVSASTARILEDHFEMTRENLGHVAVTSLEKIPVGANYFDIAELFPD